LEFIPITKFDISWSMNFENEKE